VSTIELPRPKREQQDLKNENNQIKFFGNFYSMIIFKAHFSIRKKLCHGYNTLFRTVGFGLVDVDKQTNVNKLREVLAIANNQLAQAPSV